MLERRVRRQPQQLDQPAPRAAVAGRKNVEPAEAMSRLRNHPQAGELLRQVEAWLHQPGGARDVDVPRMLAPYRAHTQAPVVATIMAEEAPA